MIETGGAQARRIAIAAAITIVAVPLAFLFGSEGTPDANTSVVTVNSDTPTTTRPSEDPLGDPGLAQFDRTVTTPPTGGAVIAVPDSNSRFPRNRLVRLRTLRPTTFALSRGAPIGMFVSIINLDNSRSTTCIAAFTLDDNSPDVVMHPDRFAAIGDPTDAPLTVEYRW